MLRLQTQAIEPATAETVAAGPDNPALELEATEPTAVVASVITSARAKIGKISGLDS